MGTALTIGGLITVCMAVIMRSGNKWAKVLFWLVGLLLILAGLFVVLTAALYDDH
jgi:uncharacterized membrane protein HdeD (DUF308 family)